MKEKLFVVFSSVDSASFNDSKRIVVRVIMWAEKLDLIASEFYMGDQFLCPTGPDEK